MSEDEVERLVALYVEGREAGEILSEEDFAAAYPSFRPELERLLRALRDTEAALSHTETPATIVGGYRIVRALGGGGSAMVFEAAGVADPNVSVAIKFLAPQAALDERARRRFQREIEALGRVRHPGVVGIVAYDTTASSPYLAMELVRGRTLAACIARARDSRQTAERQDILGRPGPVDLPHIARFLAKIARAVAAAHAEGIVHRDIKPSNIVVRPDGEPILVDFGLSGDDSATTLTRTGDVLGTPLYMAPEQARGMAADRGSDIFALGLIARECATLEPPRLQGDRRALLAHAASRPLSPPRSADGPLPRPFRLILDRAAAFDPRDRYADAAALADDLEAFADGRPIRATPLPFRRRAAYFLRSRQGRAAILAGLLLLAIAVAIVAERRRAGAADRHAAAVDQALTLLAAALLDGRDADATAAVQRLRALDPTERHAQIAVELGSGQATTSKDPAVKAAQKGLEALHAGRGAEAFTAFTEAVDACPDSALLAAWRGVAARIAERLDVAERDLTAALRVFPDSKALHENLGRLHDDRRRHAAAAKEYQAALEKDPNDDKLWYKLALALHRSGDRDGSLGAALTSLNRLGNRGVQVMNLYGVLLDADDRRDEARAAYREVLRLQPKRFGTLLNLAVSYDSAHEMREAATRYLDASAADPSQPVPLLNLAHLKSGANSDACERCRDFFRQNPDVLDFEAAERHAAEALRKDGGRNRRLVDLVLVIGARTGRTSLLREAILDSLKLLEAQSGDKPAAARRVLEDALRSLSAPQNPRN